MRVALLTSFAATRKEPLVVMMDRVQQAFADAGLEPAIYFNFGDHTVPMGVSSVDRVLRRHPELERFVTSADPAPLIPGARRISNGPLSPAAGEHIPYETLQAIAGGVPRSFPFHSAVIHFVAEVFGSLQPAVPGTSGLLPGILISDSWWVSGRQRSLSACSVVEAEHSAKRLPPLPPPMEALFAACGKVKRTIQAPLPDEAAVAQQVPVRLPVGTLMASPNPQTAQAVKAVVLDYRTRLAEVVARAGLPHDLPPQGETTSLGASPGPLKPALEEVFAPMGYSCKGGSGTFTLRRRTAANLTVMLYIDVGTWSHFALPMFQVLGVGFKATLIIPVAPRAAAGSQYHVASADQWRKIVENLAALVRELEGTFVPDIERTAGPSPEWYHPDT